MRAKAIGQAQQEQGRARQALQQQERMRKATPTYVSPADTAIKPDEVVRLPFRQSSFDYLIRNNGEIHIRRTPNKFDRFYLESSARNDASKKIVVRQYKLVGTFVKNEHGYIALPDIFETNTFAFRYTGSSPNENYISGKALAALIGALNRARICDVSLNHWSNADGSSPAPSRSHKLGNVGDIRPLRIDYTNRQVLITDRQFDAARSARLVEAFKKFGWSSILSERNPETGYITPGTTHYYKRFFNKSTGQWEEVTHKNHFHIQRFTPHLVE